MKVALGAAVLALSVYIGVVGSLSVAFGSRCSVLIESWWGTAYRCEIVVPLR